MSRNISAIMAKPSTWMLLAPGLVQQQDRDDVPGHGEDREDGELDQRVVEQRGVRVEQLEDLGRGDRVAVVAEVEQRPGPGGADQPDQHPLVLEQQQEPSSDAHADCAPSTRAVGRRAIGRRWRARWPPEPRRRRRPPSRTAASRGSGGAGRTRPGPGQRRSASRIRQTVSSDMPEPEQDRGEQRAEDQARALHGEHEPDHPAAGPLARVLAHDRGRHRVVAADADPEDDPADEQEYVVGREGRGDGPDGEDQHLVAVDPFPAEHVGDPAENDRAESRGEQRGRVEPRHLAGGKVHWVFSSDTTMPMTNRS